MSFQSYKKIYKKVFRKNILVKHACEIGVFLPQTSNVIDFINDKKVAHITLVEPNPSIVEHIKDYFKDKNNITFHPFAIHEYNGSLTLFEAGASTFANGLPNSPALVNDAYQKDEVKKIEVECKLFSEIDDGTIDLLSIDTEGCEWYALKTMLSRPKIISLETHGKFYVNPFIQQIKHWIRQENYKVWYKTNSDTIYIKKDLFFLTVMDKIKLCIMNGYIVFRRVKKNYKQKTKKWY